MWMYVVAIVCLTIRTISLQYLESICVCGAIVVYVSKIDTQEVVCGELVVIKRQEIMFEDGKTFKTPAVTNY